MAEEYPAGRYKLRSESYMPRMPGFDHELLTPGTEVVWAGRPGPHLEPLDDQARQNYEASGAAGMSLDPFASIPLTNAADDDDILAERIARAMGPAMISALGKLGFIQQQAAPPAKPAPAIQQMPPMAPAAPPAPPPPPAPTEVLPPPPPPPPPAAPAPQAKRGK
jgi:hypothetical protein